MDNSIVPVHLAVKAMRDNGYKNAAYAIAELMDNSIQHKATVVELLCAEIEVTANMRTVSRINKIAVLDNGTGMDSTVLRMALQFGNGTNLEIENQKGIGKFGMGLPSSSISQAKRVEVWTWQNGVDSAVYSYLDLDDILQQRIKEVPEPARKKIPDIWIQVGTAYSTSGTLVVWSKIDRCIWKTAQAIIDNSEFLIGRLYRKYLENSKVQINMVAFKESNLSQKRVTQALPNDPIYLMSRTSTPSPFDSSPMFKKWAEDDYEVQFYVEYRGEKHEIKVRFTYAKEEARRGHNAGAKAHGKHAQKNAGVSLIRANRELDLDQTWVVQYDSRERWWGVEVEFPPALDEVFGVTNNKQFANNFSELGKLDMEGLLKEGNKTLIQLKQELEEENDPKALLIEIAHRIKNQLAAIRGAIKAQAPKLEKDAKGRHQQLENTPEHVATEATEERKKESGILGTSDKQEATESIEARKDNVEQTLGQEGVPNPREVVELLFTTNLKYQFVDFDFESPAFFSVKPRGGKILITLNISHPAYQKLVEVLDKDVEAATIDDLKERLSNASSGLKLLLMAWARYEDEQPDGNRKNAVQDARMDWGRIAKSFLKED